MKRKKGEQIYRGLTPATRRLTKVVAEHGEVHRETAKGG
jgi:hypothetical protein